MTKFAWAEGEIVEVRGTLIELSSRFWSGGWGHGTLRTDRGRLKITGSLEGHVCGTCLVVRGVYTINEKYGAQVKASSIAVDSVTGALEVVRAWAEKHLEKYADQIADFCRDLEESERWSKLADRAVLSAAGFDEEASKAISDRVHLFLRELEAKRELMELGFTDREADKLFRFYGPEADKAFREDPYEAVIHDVLTFYRIDAVVQGCADLRVAAADTRRLCAALVAALQSAHRNGHTAMRKEAAVKEAADIAGVYPDAVQRVLPTAQRYVATYESYYQLKEVAESEQSIAGWLVEVTRRVAEEA